MLTNLRAKIKITPLQVFVYLLGIFPALWLLWDGLNDNLTVNPIQALTQRSGRYAIFFLILSLACTPINTVFGFRSVLKVRRALGLTAFFYALLHFVLFVGVDYQFNLDLLKGVIFEKPYALVGLSAFIVLFMLAVTSFRWWMKRLGKVWTRIHRFVYLAGVLVVIHYFWVVKGDFLRLSGDIAKPLIYAVVLTVLLILRVPAVRKIFANFRQRVRSFRNRKPRSSAPIQQEFN
jgi:sulfoxide reductase heme-binding subunit YedZ